MSRAANKGGEWLTVEMFSKCFKTISFMKLNNNYMINMTDTDLEIAFRTLQSHCLKIIKTLRKYMNPN